MADFLLFGTEGCHLCEEAEELLIANGIAFANKDIMDNEEWRQEYGLLIPVLWHPGSRRQLNWPFDEHQLREFIGLCKGD
ncbi:MAG: glutaredoxin family protein [Methylococcaceae bacterium]|nr:glutaredoxin family protein [Methylococcaceae bacterium]